MARLDRPLLVVSDTHLGVDSSAVLESDLARLICAHSGSEVILGGDAFDLSFATRHDESTGLLSALLDRSPELVRVLRQRLASGAKVTLLPGNHDAALCDASVAAVLRARLGVSVDAPVTVATWFVRRGDVHVEHGHVYDPDNAPVHPLAAWSDRTEPLGVALTRRFVAPTGASDFSHAQDSTPLSALSRAFRLYRHRAPGMIAKYFETAIELCLESGPALAPHAERERAVGAAGLHGFAEACGVPHSALGELLQKAPRPTHLCRRDVVFRLYFDRVFATLLFAASAPGMLRRRSSSVLALASLAYLAGSTLRSKDRYGGLPEQQLARGAAHVRELTGARLVVFGHTHHAVDDETYLNTGSFAYSRSTGRPYVTIDERGNAELRRQGAA